MIVVDSNVIAYCWVNGPLTRLAQRVRVQDPDWHVPVLWRSEMRSILTGYVLIKATETITPVAGVIASFLRKDFAELVPRLNDVLLRTQALGR